MKNLQQFALLVSAFFAVLLVCAAVGGFWALVSYGSVMANAPGSTTSAAGKSANLVNTPGPRQTARKTAQDITLAQALAAGDRKAVETVIGEYLTSNPQTIMAMLRSVQTYQREQTEMRKQKSVVRNRKALFASSGDMVFNAKGKIPVVEFFDYQCGYCKRVFASVKKLQATAKNVRFIYKEFPILGAVSMFAAQAALASRAQGKYFAYHDALMSFKGSLTKKIILEKAASIGLDVAKLRADMASKEIKATIEKNLLLGTVMGITGTPTLIFGDVLIPGAIQYRRMTQLVAQMERNCKVC